MHQNPVILILVKHL